MTAHMELPYYVSRMGKSTIGHNRVPRGETNVCSRYFMHGHKLNARIPTGENLTNTLTMEDLRDDELDGLFDDEPNNPPGTPSGNGGNGNPKLPGAVKQVITKLRDDRRQLREENERLKAERQTPPPTPPVQVADPNVEKLTFAQQHKELDWEDVENAFAIAQMKNITREAALQDTLFVAYHEKKIREKVVQANTPPPTNRSGVVLPEGKSMATLSDAERREMQEKIIRENRAKK